MPKPHYYKLTMSFINPIALRKAKIVCNFGLSECSRVNQLLKLLFLLENVRNIGDSAVGVPNKRLTVI